MTRSRALLLFMFSSGPGCAPVAHLRPASGLEPGRTAEVGLAMATLGPRPYVEEDTEVTGQLWGSTDIVDWLSLSLIAAFDESALATGAAARLNVIRTQVIAAGFEVEAGYAWGAMSAGGAARLFDRTWIYTAPRIGTLGSDWTFGIPAGVSIGVYDGLSLRAEAQLSWAELAYYNRRQHFGAGVAYQF